MRNYKAKFKNLRKRYPKFIYQDYLYNLKGGNLEISFLFIIEPNIQFRPTLIIKNIDKSRIKKTGKEVLANLIFHLGLIEIPTYWKTTCSPEIIIKAGYLDKEQIKWWKNLIIKGMGQFFYENKIDWRKPNFIKIICPKNLTEQSGKKSTIVGILPEEFFRVVKAGFSQPRKMLINNLSAKLRVKKGLIREILQKNHINPAQRPETLTIKDWVQIAKEFSTFPLL